MKILKTGRPQKGWSIEVACTGRGNGNGGCGAVLLVEQADVFITSSHCRDESTNYNTFKCEACGVLTDLGDNVLLPFCPLPRSRWEAARKVDDGAAKDEAPRGEEADHATE